MESVLTKTFMLRNLSTYGAIIVMFTYSILLDRDFACTCKPQEKECILYMSLPVFLIFVLILWTDKTFLRICRYTCLLLHCSGCFKCRFCTSFFRQFFKAVLTGLLWVAFVFLDGDWYVCCQNDHSEQQAHLACKNKANLTDEDRVVISELKNKSRVIGSCSLLGIIFLAALMSCVGWRNLWSKCCENKWSCCDRNNVYYRLILEEEGNVLKELLTESAKKELTERIEGKIRHKQWEDCLNVAENLIKASTNSTQQESAEQLDEQRGARAGEESASVSPM